jgi:GT2 family glycosyltransferase
MEEGTRASNSAQPHSPTASVLIVGYKSRSYIERCVEGALRSAKGESIEVLFIDCSDDGTEQFIRERFPEVRVVPFQGNLGFARGNNTLAAHARGEYIILLNPDAFARENEIAALIQLARETPNASAWAGVTYLPDGSVDGGSVQPMLGALPLVLAIFGLAHVKFGPANPRGTSPKSVPVLTGAFMMVRTEVWRRLEGFDERFFMYAEEVDLCKRIANDGGVLLCDPRIRMLHDTGSGERRTPTRLLNRARGDATFFRKHYGPLWCFLCRSALFLHAWSRFLGGTALGRQAIAQSHGAVAKAPQSWWNGWKTSGIF